jgi:hypothetical protein
MKSSPVFFVLGQSILLRTLSSKTLNLCSFLSGREKVSNPYKKKSEIIVSYILIFKLLKRRQEDN